MPEELIPIALFASIAAVLILRPLTKRLGLLIEAAVKERQPATDNPGLERLSLVVDRLVDRIDRLEDRVDFAERLLEHSGHDDVTASRTARSSVPVQRR